MTYNICMMLKYSTPPT